MQLTKHHGWGNDFLVLIDLDDRVPVDEVAARALCDRHRGVGADGVIRVTRGGDGADVAMELRNADGSVAETSGNGLRCLAQAVVRAGVVAIDTTRDFGTVSPPIARKTAPKSTGGTAFTVATVAGLRPVVVIGDPRATTIEVRVDMGPARPLASPPALAAGPVTAQKTMALDLGNPHLVQLHTDAGEVAEMVAVLGPDLLVNVELLIPGPGPDAVTMRVVERGVGETQACGTGACAAAHAAHEWGLVGPRVVVHQPGGEARIELGDTIVLTGPATYVATVEVPAWR